MWIPKDRASQKLCPLIGALPNSNNVVKCVTEECMAWEPMPIYSTLKKDDIYPYTKILSYSKDKGRCSILNRE